MTVRASVRDGVASTEIEQVVRNTGAGVAEADWLLPLPEGAVADGFTMVIGDKELAGEVLDAGNARAVYERIVRQRRDPGLLEYYGQGCLRARVYPIPAHGEVVVKVRFRHVLAPLDGMRVWSFPLRALAASGLSPARCNLDVVIDSTVPLKTVFAPGVDVDVRRADDHRARVSFEGALDALPPRDIQVFYGLADRDFGLDVLSCKRAGEDGYFMLLMAPKLNWSDENKIARCVQFVLDTSGSMQGRKIEQAKAALRFFVSSLRPQDSFNIIPFATEAAPFFSVPAQAHPMAVEAAMQRIDTIEARGGTNIEDALQRALSAKVTATEVAGVQVLPIVVFLTDGEPTVGETNATRLLAKARSANATRARVFVFGVGDSLDTKLLDRLADENGGSRDYVREDEDIELKTSALFTKLSHPVLTDLALTLNELDAYDVQPSRLPDMFQGSQIAVFGRYRTAGTHALQLRGTAAGAARDYAATAEFVRDSMAHDFVPTLWAQRKIAYLLDAIHQNGRNPELLDEVQRLSREFGVVTPFTSHLILEEGMRLARDDKATMPFQGPVGRSDGAFGPSTPGSSGPNTPGPSGPATGGPAGGAARDRLAKLGTNYASTGRVADSRDISVVSGSDDFYLGGSRRAGPIEDGAERGIRARRVGARTFYQVGQRWIDAACKTDWHKSAERVVSFSPEYFALLEQHADLKAVFALDERVVVMVGARVIEVTSGA